jgi:hypothetical protein
MGPTGSPETSVLNPLTLRNNTEDKRIQIEGNGNLQIMADQKKLENVEYFKYLGSMITNHAKPASDTESRFAMEKATFNWKKTSHVFKPSSLSETRFLVFGF